MQEQFSPPSARPTTETISYVGRGSVPPLLTEARRRIVDATPEQPVPLGEPVLAVAADLDALSASEVSTLSQALQAHRHAPPLIALSDGLSGSSLPQLLEHHGVRHLVGWPEASTWAGDLRVTLDRLSGTASTGIADYLAPDTEIHHATVLRSDEKPKVATLVEDVARGFGVAPRVHQTIRTALDELLTNALYDAPLDANGNPRCADWPRTRPVELDPHESVEVSYGGDGERFAVSVVDPFGSLRPERVQAEVARWLRGSQAAVREGPGGAGIGLLQVFSALAHLVVDVHRDARTEVIGVFDIRGGYRRLVRASKSVDIFVEEETR